MIGYEKERNEVLKLRDMLLRSDEYEGLGLRIPRGLMIYGPHGSGKTVLAEELGGEGVTLIVVNVSELPYEKVYDAISEGMKKAKESSPAVLVLDEFDSSFMSQNPFSDGGNEMRSFLQALFEKLEASDRVLVVVTCQDPGWANASLTKSGRFEKIICLGLPDEKTRYEMLESFLGRINIEKEFCLADVARLTAGCSGGEIERLANEIGLEAVSKGLSSITLDDFNNTMTQHILGAENHVMLCDEEKHQIAVHEAGHIITALMLDPDSLYGASIVPRENSLGHVRYVNDETPTGTAAELENNAVIMLAGHVAERMFLGGYLIGSSSDINKACNLVYDLVTQEAAYGYDYVLLCQGRRIDSIAFEGVRDMAARTVAEKLDEFDQRAEKIISEKEELYMKIVSALEKKGTLSRQELLEMGS